MDIAKSNIFHRWEMLTNPHSPEVRLTKLLFLEVIENTMLIDEVNDGQPFSDSEIGQCRRRLMRSCQYGKKN